MLERFRQAKAAEVAGLEKLAASRAMPPPYAGPRPSFTAALRAKAPLAVIAEYKRASPSRGDINLDCGPEQAAEAYALAGAGAVSVLTEEEHFKGRIGYLARMAGPGLPLLRKDFILHPLQVEQTAATPASALLLIVRMLDSAMLRALIFKSRDLGLEPVAEIFDLEDLLKARDAGASIIQVNNRDLELLKVDRSVSGHLAARRQRDEFWITASGIETAEQLRSLLAFGFDAALVGSSLMRGSDPGGELAKLLHGEAAHG
jgi:indole-3-glycerol phosphate synthase